MDADQIDRTERGHGRGTDRFERVRTRECDERKSGCDHRTDVAIWAIDPGAGDPVGIVTDQSVQMGRGGVAQLDQHDDIGVRLADGGGDGLHVAVADPEIGRIEPDRGGADLGSGGRREPLGRHGEQQQGRRRETRGSPAPLTQEQEGDPQAHGGEEGGRGELGHQIRVLVAHSGERHEGHEGRHCDQPRQ
jgi:hypothetical protein